ncbi:MAG: hypothetical protein H0U18_11695 [Pyrinomonadaceae bacterium]|nr:hypothetical protein [Pyrinomonadaceae bacterium]
MDEQSLKLPCPASYHALRRAGRIGDNHRQPNFRDAKLLNQLLLERLNVVVCEEENLLRA